MERRRFLRFRDFRLEPLSDLDFGPSWPPFWELSWSGQEPINISFCSAPDGSKSAPRAKEEGSKKGCKKGPKTGGGRLTQGGSRVGGDLGESIPKGIDVGLCEALVKSKQPNSSPLRYTA